jgi:hypothetical protein
MARRVNAREEIEDELNDKAAALRKYRRQSLWLLVPLAVPMAAFTQRDNSAQ